MRRAARESGAGERTGRKLRPEIQALRALAVLLVVVHHLWPAAVPGGYVGVDVFFAISGFVITLLLLEELDATRRISIAAFWARRARRILPAALTTLVFCVVATILLVPVTAWSQSFAEARASAAYVENWHLSATAAGYFTASDEPTHVRHFWSLSVEEQFYLAWPIVLMLLAGAARGRSAVVRRRLLAGGLLALAAASLTYSVAVTAADPVGAYYLTPARAWEFAAGGLLALLPATLAGPARLAALSWAGLAAIVASAFLYTPATPFPGVAALLPVLGACAVMGAGDPARRWAPAPVLRARPAQYLGGISYAVYLWHWPLLVLAPFVIDRAVDDRAAVVILILTLLVASASKVLIEDPMRSHTLPREPPADVDARRGRGCNRGRPRRHGRRHELRHGGQGPRRRGDGGVRAYRPLPRSGCPRSRPTLPRPPASAAGRADAASSGKGRAAL